MAVLSSSREEEKEERKSSRSYSRSELVRKNGGIPDNGRSSGVDGGQRPFSDDID